MLEQLESRLSAILRVEQKEAIHHKEIFFSGVYLKMLIFTIPTKEIVMMHEKEAWITQHRQNVILHPHGWQREYILSNPSVFIFSVKTAKYIVDLS